MVMGKIKLEMNSECGVSGISLDQNACVIVANNPEDIVAEDDDDDMMIIIIIIKKFLVVAADAFGELVMVSFVGYSSSFCCLCAPKTIRIGNKQQL